MPQEPLSQRLLYLKLDFRWGIILGLPLGIIFALVFYFGYGSSTSNVITEQDNLLLEYGLLIFLFSL
jgi:hypothetical protein